MAAPWKIAIFGTDTFYEPDSKSEVTLATLETSDPMTDTDWLKIDVAGMGPKPIPINETEERVGGIVVHGKTHKYLLDCKTLPFNFPADMADYFNLFAALNHKYIYLYKGTYDFTEFDIHSDSKAVMVACTHQIEDDYENGRKDVSLSFRKVYPE